MFEDQKASVAVGSELKLVAWNKAQEVANSNQIM